MDSGTATYIFTGSKLYAVPLDTDLAPSGAVALQLDVTYDGIAKVSDSTEVPVFKDDSGTSEEEPDNPGTNPGGDTGGNTGGNTGGKYPMETKVCSERWESRLCYHHRRWPYSSRYLYCFCQYLVR